MNFTNTLLLCFQFVFLIFLAKNKCNQTQINKHTDIIYICIYCSRKNFLCYKDNADKSIVTRE